MTEDLYKTLNLSERATADEIQRAYRMLALRHHPDRNSQSGSATLMAAINRAYEVLSEPASRAAYDKTQVSRDNGIEHIVIAAARDILTKRSWMVTQDGQGDLVLRNGSRCAHISLTGVLNAERFERLQRRATGFCAVLAVRIEPPVSVPLHTAVVLDLMHSRVYGGDFPDPPYKELFKPLLV